VFVERIKAKEDAVYTSLCRSFFARARLAIAVATMHMALSNRRSPVPPLRGGRELSFASISPPSTPASHS